MSAEDPKFDIYSKLKLPTQIANYVRSMIDGGTYKNDQQLLSINLFSRKYGVARDTVEKAYHLLKAEGYIVSVPGKGYFISGDDQHKLRVLLIFNKLSYYKKVVYDAIVETLGTRAGVDLQIHHYDLQAFAKIIKKNAGNYHVYVLMPHFASSNDDNDIMRIVGTIPRDQLICLDKKLPLLNEQKGVYQNFQDDIKQALLSVSHLVVKYQRIIVVFPAFSNHPKEILNGVAQFCELKNIELSILPDLEQYHITAGDLFIVLTESDLAVLIKKVRQSAYELGTGVGIVSFNETIFKELLDITVITTDFYKMGQTVGQMILNHENTVVNNPFKIIVRKSL